jgi:hypothetical protein
MKRREFIALFGGAAAAWPLAAQAQQPAMPVVGFLNSQSPVPFSHMVAGFRRGLSEGGFVEGQNIAIEYRWAEGHYERLPTLANELVRRGPAVLVATGGTLACRGPQTQVRPPDPERGDHGEVAEGTYTITGNVVRVEDMEWRSLGGQVLRPTDNPATVATNAPQRPSPPSCL